MQVNVAYSRVISALFFFLPKDCEVKDIFPTSALKNKKKEIM